MLELAFQADRGSGEPVYRQLEAYLRGLVEAGRLSPGEKLPATRELANALPSVEPLVSAVPERGRFRASKAAVAFRSTNSTSYAAC